MSYQDKLLTILNNPFNGKRGWIAVNTFDQLQIYTPGMRYSDVNFIDKEEFITPNGSIYVYLEKLS